MNSMKQLLISLTTLAALSAIGCSGLPTVGGIATPKADPELAEKLSKVVYPGAAEAMGDDLNMVAEQNGRSLRLRNFEPRSFADVQLWLNQQYVSQVDAISIGQDNTLDLVAFINEHGEPFPTGSFLSPDKAKRLVLIELFDPATGKRHRLVVQETRKPFF